MKYFIAFIVLAVVIFMTIDGKKPKKPRTTTPPGTPKWRHWNGKQPLNAKHIAEAATRLFYKCGYDNFKFKKVYKTEKREINGFWRYRVKFTAKKCKKSKEVDTCKKGRKDKKGRKGKKGKKCEKEKKIILYDCYKNSKEFEAIFRDNLVHDSLRLNVTNLENDNSCTLVIKY